MKNIYRVAHYPQIPCNPFIIRCKTVTECKRIRDILCDYDLFQYQNHIKPDYANISVIQQRDYENNEWCDLEEQEIDDILAEEQKGR